MPRWALLGKIGDRYAEKSFDMLKRWGPYTAQKKHGEISFAVSFSERGASSLLRNSDWMDQTTITLFDQGKFPQGHTAKDIDKFSLPPNSTASLPKLLAARSGIHRFERICRIIFHSSLAQLTTVLTQIVAPDFFKSYPKGHILYVDADPRFHMALGALRVLGFTSDLADRNYDELAKLGPFRMLSDVQDAGVFYPGKHLTIPIALFLPMLYGFVSQKVTLAFLFVFDTPIPEVREFYPRSGLEFIRAGASGLFRQSVDVDVQNVHTERIDKFALIIRQFNNTQFREFTDEYLSHLSHFASFMVDPSNFSRTGTNEWAGLTHYRAWLSIERIADEVIVMLTDDSAFLRKMALFRIMDQLASLVSEDIRAQSDIFKQFLLPGTGPDRIADGLDAYKSEIGKHLCALLIVTRNELREVVLDSVYVSGKVDRSREVVTLPDSSVIGFDDYVANTVRELRNTYHGYYTKQFDKFLAISSGDTPDSLPLIGALSYLALVAKPQLFVGRAW